MATTTQRNKKCQLGTSKQLRSNMRQCKNKDKTSGGCDSDNCSNSTNCKIDCGKTKNGVKTKCLNSKYTPSTGKNKDKKGDYTHEAHHIIPKGDFKNWEVGKVDSNRLDKLQLLLKKIGTDNCQNGVCVPMGNHKALHKDNKDYVETLSDYFDHLDTDTAKPKEIHEALEAVRKDILSNNFF